MIPELLVNLNFQLGSFSVRVLIGSRNTRQDTYRAPVLLDIETDTELGSPSALRDKLAENLDLELVTNLLTCTDRLLAFANQSTPEVALITYDVRIAPKPAIAANFAPPFPYGRIVAVSSTISDDGSLKHDVGVSVGKLVTVTTGSITIVGVRSSA